MDTYAALTRRVEHLEFGKVAQAMDIIKLKQRVKKLEKRNKVRVLKLRRLQKVETSQRVKTSNDTVMDDESNQGRMIAEMDQDDVVVLEDDKEEDREVTDAIKDVKEAKVDESDQEQGRQAESQAKIYKIDMDHANKVLSMQEDKTEPAEVQEVVDSKDKGKGILVEEPKPLKKKQQIKQDEQYAKELHVELNKDIDCDEAIDHNVARFKMDYFKGLSYDDIRLVFEKYFDSNVAFLIKSKKHMDEEDSRALKRLNETPAEKAAKKQKEDLEALWSLVKEIFLTKKPKNFSDDFLLVTLGAMFEKPNIHAQIWKNQRTIHGLVKVKGWKLLESCGMQIITFTSTQLILLVEKKYPLTRFTLDQMLNVVRLKVEEESKVSLELLSFRVDAAMDMKKNMLSD
uniref:Uncharacterized protein n=1 Tax=Tanacetum cinerariifolium TaxID=118510 RepID=A0A699JVH2_TANCI|nr:hypothetical protein [Tanacetum cinerariifolium]